MTDAIQKIREALINEAKSWKNKLPSEIAKELETVSGKLQLSGFLDRVYEALISIEAQQQPSSDVVELPFPSIKYGLNVTLNEHEQDKINRDFITLKTAADEGNFIISSILLNGELNTFWKTHLQKSLRIIESNSALPLNEMPEASLPMHLIDRHFPVNQNDLAEDINLKDMHFNWAFNKFDSQIEAHHSGFKAGVKAALTGEPASIWKKYPEVKPEKDNDGNNGCILLHKVKGIIHDQWQYWGDEGYWALRTHEHYLNDGITHWCYESELIASITQEGK